MSKGKSLLDGQSSKQRSLQKLARCKTSTSLLPRRSLVGYGATVSSTGIWSRVVHMDRSGEIGGIQPTHSPGWPLGLSRGLLVSAKYSWGGRTEWTEERPSGQTSLRPEWSSLHAFVALAGRSLQHTHRRPSVRPSVRPSSFTHPCTHPIHPPTHPDLPAWRARSGSRGSPRDGWELASSICLRFD